MLSHAANIAVPIWRGTYCFLQCFFPCIFPFSVCPPTFPLFLPLLLSPLMPSPTSGISIALKVNLMEKWVWKRAVKPGTGADGGEGGDAWPVPSSACVTSTPNCTDQGWGQGRAQIPVLLLPHPPVSCMHGAPQTPSSWERGDRYHSPDHPSL